MEIETLLQEMGPVLSSDLSGELQQRLNLKPEAARKRIQRAKLAGKIKALEKLNLRRNEQFLFLPEHVGKGQLVKSLKKGLSKAQSPLYDALIAIQARGGMILQTAFPAISGLPMTGKKKLLSENAKDLLLEYQLIVEKENSLGSCFQLNKDVFSHPAETRRLSARLRAEQICIQGLLDWLRLQGMVTAQKASIRGAISPPQFGFFAWDLVSPSYIHALTHHVENRIVNGFVVADVCLGKELTVADVQYFFNKVISASSPYNRPFISFLIGKFFDKDALLLGRKLGIMLTTPSNLFGIDFDRILEDVVELLDTPDWQTEEQTTEMQHLMDKMAQYRHLEGVMANLLADTFEFFVAHCNTVDWGRPMFGKKFKDSDNTPYDCDILFRKQGKGILAIECKKKNRNSLVSDAEISHWFETVAPLIYAENQKDKYFKDKKCEFSIWTNSDFNSDALALLKKLKSKTSSYEITWKKGQDVKQLLRETQDSKLLDIYKKHFDK